MSFTEIYPRAEQQLNAPEPEERLAAVRLLAYGVLHGDIPSAAGDGGSERPRAYLLFLQPALAVVRRLAGAAGGAAGGGDYRP